MQNWGLLCAKFSKGPGCAVLCALRFVLCSVCGDSIQEDRMKHAEIFVRPVPKTCLVGI